MAGEHCEAQKTFKQKQASWGDYTIQRIGLFKNDMAAPVLHSFHACSPSGTELDKTNRLVKRFIVWLVGLDASQEVQWSFESRKEHVLLLGEAVPWGVLEVD